MCVYDTSFYSFLSVSRSIVRQNVDVYNEPYLNILPFLLFSSAKLKSLNTYFIVAKHDVFLNNNEKCR